MDVIISKIYELLKKTDNLIEFEEQIQILMHQTFASLVGDAFNKINHVIKENKQLNNWNVERTDPRRIQFIFGEVQFNHTLMHDENGMPRYPLDEWLGIRKRQRYSPLVEYKAAELASESDYRESARIMNEWTAVQISHTTIGNIVRKVGNAQSKADSEMVNELEFASQLPEAKKVDILYAEADGVFVRDVKKKKHHEVSHAIVYEGWERNGNRVSLTNRKVMMTTQPIEEFWQEVQAFTTHEYSLEQTQIISNSDGGIGYASHRFKEAFSQSNFELIHQLDGYHVGQALNRTFGWKKSDIKSKVKQAIDEYKFDEFKLLLDTYESNLEDEKDFEKVKKLRTYILGHWEYIKDWRKRIENVPDGARGLGGMESNQRHISFRMKKRGMHWSSEGAEAMVKIKQGLLNNTLKSAYLKHQEIQEKRSDRKNRKFKRHVHMGKLLHQKTSPSIGVRQGSISLYSAHSSAIGKLAKLFK